MDKSTQSGFRDKKTQGTADNWKEIKYHESLEAAPKRPAQSTFDKLMGSIKYGGGYKGPR